MVTFRFSLQLQPSLQKKIIWTRFEPIEKRADLSEIMCWNFGLIFEAHCELPAFSDIPTK